MITRILTVLLFAASFGMLGYLYYSIDKVIEDKKLIASKEAAVTEALKLIRDAEIVYLSVNGKYTANWDSLRNFIATGQVPLIDRHEEIIQKAYGGEEVKVIIDTLGFIPAKEAIFKKKYDLNAGDDGKFIRYNVKVGDNVFKTQRAFAYSVASGEVREQPFIEEGVVELLEPLTAGQEIKRGQHVISYYRYIYDPNIDIKTIGLKPGSDKPFDIFVGNVDRAGVAVQVIEVKDPTPDNPGRKESNEQATRKPLRFGSKVEISTAGNWE